jgi:hypothetical protein
MKRTLILIFFALFLVREGYSQSAESWINYSQSYYKIPVGEDGIYRLTYSDLQEAGFPVDVVDPGFIQLFHRGVEQAIYVEGETDSRFDVADFIEFFGRRNDGTLDAGLYNPGAQPHSYHNIFSDTTSYFLTIGPTSGKRMSLISGANPDNILPAPFVENEILLVAKEQYAVGKNLNNEVSTSSFDQGEGWSGNLIAQGGQLDYTLTGIDLRETTGTPKLEVALLGRNVFFHGVDIYVGPSLRLLKSVMFGQFESVQILEDILWSDISDDGKLTIRIRVLNAGAPNYVSLSFARIVYPQKTDAAFKNANTFYVPENASGKTYLEIANPPAGYRLFDVTDPSSVIRVGTTTTTTANTLLPFSDRRKIFGTGVFKTPKIKLASFRSLVAGAYNFVIISHPDLRVPSGIYTDPVKAYAEYRASEAGGSYDTLVMNMPMLYDQFSYGEKTPLAIVNFLKYVSQGGVPEYLFLIGKGIDVWYNYHRNPGGLYQDFVPTSGYPGSDMHFSAGINGSGEVNAISTGRLSVTNSSQISAYLNKIRAMESAPSGGLWRKNILHLSGGIEEGEPELFRSILEEFGSIAEGPYLGGQVEAIAKQSRDVQVINIAEQINNGVGLVTFFGHSSPSTLDFDIGYASDLEMGYNNKGKYPTLLMNGCEAGAFFLKGYLFGEDWINSPDKGASAFIAHSAYGLVPALRKYTSTLYEVGYGDSLFLDKGIGDIQRETARRVSEEFGTELVELSVIQQMILLGDPSVKLFGESRADLEINADNISIKSFSNDPVTVLSDSFAIEMVVRNFGLASKKAFRIEVTRTFGDNKTQVYDSIFRIPPYSDTLTFVIRQQGGIGGGNNSFTITLDPDEFIDEVNEANNQVELNYLLPANGTKNLFPHSYGIVRDREIKLSFQATDVFSGTRDFIVELDTTRNFDSPFKKSFTPSGDVFVTIPVNLISEDTTAYFWRSRLANPSPNESSDWNVSSFTFIEGGEEGWAQITFAQLLEDPAIGIVKDESVRRVHFQETRTPIDVLTFGASAGKPADSVSVKIDGQEYNLYTQEGGEFGCRNNTINLIAFDKNSTVPYVGVYFKWYEILFNYGGRRLVCGREPFVINSFVPNEVNTGNNDDLIYYVDQVAQGDSVLLYNIGDAGISSWPAAARAKVAELGISEAQLSSIIPGAPFVIFAKKGSPVGSAKLFTTADVPPVSGRLEVSETITGGYSSGTLTTTTIGPAVDWNKLLWNVKEIEANDNVSVSIVGIDFNGEETVLFQDVPGELDLSSVDAMTFPYLRVALRVSDDLLLTAAQLKHWVVLYTPAPDGLLIPVSNQTLYEVNEGETWSGEFRFINISDKSFPDSLAVNVTGFNTLKRTHVQDDFKILQPEPGDTTMFTVSMNTLGAGGLNDLAVRVNPRVLPELYYDNNIFQRADYLLVREDDLAPVLEVSVDGRSLVNRDYVSSSPVIEIILRDENPHIFKTDTVGMRIFLTYPCDQEQCEATYVSLNQNQVEWSPATADSDFNIIWRPENLLPGEYTLKVEGADAHGNTSSLPYIITFRVEDEFGLSVISPYPNPAGSDISYGFVAKGDDIPVEVILSITDLTGRTIITQQTDGEDFHTGTNVFLWTVQDSAGTSFPAGLYIYSISIRTSTETFVRQGKLLIKQ